HAFENIVSGMVRGPNRNDEYLWTERGDEKRVLGIAITVVVQNADFHRTYSLRHRRFHVVPEGSAGTAGAGDVAATVKVELAVAHSDPHRAHVLSRIFFGFQV